jgi:hypothetical protein
MTRAEQLILRLFPLRTASRWMLDKVDVDGGSREQPAREDCNEVGNLAHGSTVRPHRETSKLRALRFGMRSSTVR